MIFSIQKLNPTLVQQFEELKLRTASTNEFDTTKRYVNSARNTGETLSLAPNINIGPSSLPPPTKNELGYEHSQIDQKMLKAKNILIQTRSFFKGSQYKSCNKYNTNKSHEEFIRKVATVYHVQSQRPDKEKLLMQALELKAGNCGEMAGIAFALCHQQGMSPEMIGYEDPSNPHLNHAACLIKIGDDEYVIDPWANTFCKLENHIDALVCKVKHWEERGKLFLIQTYNTESEQNSSDKDSIGVTLRSVTEAEMKNLVFYERTKPETLINFSSSNFFLHHASKYIKHPIPHTKI